jgi:hypothetical protein
MKTDVSEPNPADLCPSVCRDPIRLRTKSGRGLPHSKTLREPPARVGNSARSWSAPVPWRFGGARETDDGRKWVWAGANCHSTFLPEVWRDANNWLAAALLILNWLSTSCNLAGSGLLVTGTLVAAHL